MAEKVSQCMQVRSVSAFKSVSRHAAPYCFATSRGTAAIARITWGIEHEPSQLATDEICCPKGSVLLREA